MPHITLCYLEGLWLLVIWIPIPTGQTPHIALRCLEGSTMSNLVHRRRRCARIGLHSILCLEGSTPEDRFFYYHGLNG